MIEIEFQMLFLLNRVLNFLNTIEGEKEEKKIVLLMLF